MSPSSENDSPISIRSIFPELEESEAREADERAQRFLEHAWRIYLEICADPDRKAQLDRDLTELRNRATIPKMVDKNDSRINDDDK